MPQSGSSYLFELETERQKTALAGLKPISGLKPEQFHSLLLRQLWIISRPDIYHSPRKHQAVIGRSTDAVPAARVRKLRRSAKLAQEMAERLTKQANKLSSFGLSGLARFPQPPVEALRSYANILIAQADADQQHVARPQLRHRTHQETWDIIFLVRFVEQETGKPHWNRLATLLQAALRNPTFDADGLRKLVKYHEKKYYEAKGAL